MKVSTAVVFFYNYLFIKIKTRTPTVIAIKRRTTPPIVPIRITIKSFLFKISEKQQYYFSPFFLDVFLVNFPVKFSTSLLFNDDKTTVVGIITVDDLNGTTGGTCP